MLKTYPALVSSVLNGYPVLKGYMVSEPTPSGLGFDPSDAGSMIAIFGPTLSRLVFVALMVLTVRYLVRWAIGRVDDDRTRKQLHFFAPKVLQVLTAIAGFELVGIDISNMAAILATIGVTVAVVFTPVGQNFVAGAMVRIDNLYRVGEIVTVGDMFGRVIYQSVLRTELELPDGTKAWVPNSKFQDEQVLNHSRMGGFRVSVDVPLDGTPNRGLAVSTMEGVLSSLAWNSPGKRAYVVFDYVGGEAMFFKAFAWIEDRTTEPYYRGLLLTALVDALEAEGLSVGQTTNLSLSSQSRQPSTSEELEEPAHAV